jgi:hypothetical protein
MMRAKRSVRGGMKIRAYPVLCRAIEEGVAYGWRRAHKHIDTPDVGSIEEQIVTAVLNEICQLSVCRFRELEPRFPELIPG